MNQDLYTPGQLSKLLSVTPETLRLWEIQKKLTSVTTKGKHRRYLYKTQKQNDKITIAYARVSSIKQKSDLQRQIDFLKKYSKGKQLKIITDIGSGLNFKRKGLLEVLEQLFQGNIQEIVVAHRDRLSRFGFELFQFIAEQHRCILTVIDDQIQKEPLGEFADDIMSIITTFTAKYYGKRKYQIHQKNQNIPNKNTKRSVQKVYRRQPLYIQQGKQIHKR